MSSLVKFPWLERNCSAHGTPRRRGSAAWVVKPVCGVEVAGIPVNVWFAVRVVRAGFREVVPLRAGEAAVLPGIAVIDHCCLTDGIGSEHQVGSAGIAHVEEGVV